MKHKELCDSIIISVKSILQDAEELKAKEAKIRTKAIDEFLYFVGEMLATISMDSEERAELYALLQIKANELKEQKNDKADTSVH